MAISKSNNLIFLLAAFLAIVASGCKEEVRSLPKRASESATLREAEAAYNSGDLDRALVKYKSVLYADAPAHVHRQIALLLHEHARDYVGALYHYRAYLEATPELPPLGVEIISNHIANAEQHLAAAFVAKIAGGSANANVKLTAQINTLNKRIKDLENEKAALASTNSLLVQVNAQIQRENANLMRWKENFTGASAAATPSVHIPQRTTTPDGKTAFTYQVQAGDSLSKIANDMYGDSNRWKEIRDANPDKVDSQNRVRAGEIIVIPNP